MGIHTKPKEQCVCQGSISHGSAFAHVVGSNTKMKRKPIMASKRGRVYLLHPRTAAQPRQNSWTDPGVEPITIELSAEARENLAKLQLKSLDRDGRSPKASQVIERLINAAADSEPDLPYPKE